MHFYLFSDDGRVYRAFDSIAVTGGDFRSFNFEDDAAADPVNSGRYSIEGKQLTLRMGSGSMRKLQLPCRTPAGS